LGFSLALRVEGLVRVIEDEEGGGGERLIKDLKRKANSRDNHLGFRVIEDDNHDNHDNHFSVFPANFFVVQSFIASTFHLQLKMMNIWKHTQIQGLGIRPLLCLGIRPLLKFRV